MGAVRELRARDRAAKTEYYRVLRQCQMQRPGEEMTPWVHFFWTAWW